MCQKLKTPKSIILVTVLATALFLSSCSKKEITQPIDETSATEFGIYHDMTYPAIPTEPIAVSDQRFVGGTTASDSNDGSQDAPWATFDKALRELSASTTWYCLNLAANITVDTFIDTKFYGSGPGNTSQFAYIRSAPSLTTPATLILNARVEIDGQQNWLWYGFKMAGSEGINLGEDTQTNYHTVRKVKGIMTGTGGDNHGFFQALNYNANYFGVFNCNFSGPGLTDVHGNTAAIIVFGISHMRIENNVFTNVARPLYFKHSNQAINGPADIHIRYNYQPETATGESCFIAGRAEGGVFEIVDNIFGGTLEISNGGGSEQPDGHYIAHNTFLKDLKLENGNDPVINTTLQYNIILGNLELLRYSTNTNTNTSDHELIAGNIYYQSDTYTLAQWQQNAVPSNQDVHSIAGTPNFVATLLEPKSYELAINSLGKKAANDDSDLGANVTHVGNK